MSVLDLRGTTALDVLPRVGAAATGAVRLGPFQVRMLAAAALAVAGWAPLYLGVLADLPGGSRAAYLLAVPVLLAVLAAGYRTPPCGVGDAESDWIVAVLLGVAGITAIEVLTDRLPTLAGLWRLPALSGVVWFACVLIVLFGVRHAVRMWMVWVFAVAVTTPLPFLLLTAELGGSDSAAIAVSAGIGAAAVALATPDAPWRLRTVATLICLGAGLLIAWAWSTEAGLITPAVLVTGVLPVLAILVVHARVATSSVPLSFPLPQRSTSSMALLACLAAVLALVGVRSDSGHSAEASVSGAWIERTAWGAPREFPFITRYLGPHSTLQRFSMLPVDGLPAAAVDVMSTPDAGALRDLADAVWYPSARPLDYRAAGGDGLPAGARVLHSNADAVTSGADTPWYAVTWTWTSGPVHQRITVIVSQSLTGSIPPPAPAPLSLPDTSVRPLLWLARQQPDDTGGIDDLVAARVRTVVDQVSTAVARSSDEHTGV
ncbi:hypothetical protein FK535_12115 [Mycolicibacterium sp. 018/SC-01/001]|uniref:hypothetical protein n=1 Tax=Mycolicibacterium sp. 018/SC-01/001 TaxID=2592069 RepID=UPI00117D7F2C|nr:hypothetical protein [Mycolicibacterium sp. 018/SC-01/001]TRW82706.1 hypothetical protein FK535_12115 [Mycolicibacterium sp. 018/SC-01/001]